MSDPKHTSTLSDFLRDHAALLERLRQSRLPELLTINGKPEFVIQDAESYQKLVDLADQVDARNKIGAAIDRMRAGAPGVPAVQALADIRRRIDAIKKRHSGRCWKRPSISRETRTSPQIAGSTAS